MSTVPQSNATALTERELNDFFKNNQHIQVIPLGAKQYTLAWSSPMEQNLVISVMAKDVEQACKHAKSAICELYDLSENEVCITSCQRS
jgi:undecaprenyl pyrophosphate synthase